MTGTIDWSRYGSLQEYQPGDMVFREGDPGDSLYVIKTGRVVILKQDEAGIEPLTLGARGAGRLLGEVSLLQGTPRTASVQAVEPTELYVLPRDVFWQQFDSDPEFRRVIMHTLINHLLVADQGRIDAAATQRGLAELIRLRQDMTNFIVHDLQNPLSLVLIAIGEIQTLSGYDPASESGEMVEMANNGVERMLRLVSSLLDTEKLASADAKLDATCFNMGELMREIVERNQPIASHKAIQLKARPAPPDLPLVKADRLQIDRVLTNLIDNALKFTPMNGTITMSVESSEGWIAVSVNDTGPEIPPENRDHVFLRFVQTETGVQSKRGFGLGLAYCHAAIMAHDGRIWVEDGNDGVGSKFVFSLPLTREAGSRA